MKLAGRLDMVVSQMDALPFQESDHALIFTADQPESGGESENDEVKLFSLLRVNLYYLGFWRNGI